MKLTTVIEVAPRVASVAARWIGSEGDRARAFSFGLLGSFASDHSSIVSDIDFYLVGRNPDGLQTAASTLQQHLKATFKPWVVERVSLYFATLEDLEKRPRGHRIPDATDRSRWPAYEQRALKEGRSRHLAGFVFDRNKLWRPDRTELVLDSARFFEETLLRKLRKVEFFEHVETMRGDEAERMGQVAISKCVTMPLRLLYLTLPASNDALIVPTEQAIEACERECDQLPFFPLVELASTLRTQLFESSGDWNAAAELLNAHAKALYAHVLASYLRELNEFPESGVAELKLQLAAQVQRLSLKQ